MKTKNFWAAGIVLTLVIFLFGTIGLVVLACSQRIDLVKSDYYADEIQFQKQIESRNRAQSPGTSAQVVYLDSQQIKISFSPEMVHDFTRGRIELYRPDAADLDRKLDLKPDAGGVQMMDAKNLRAGLWRVKIFWNAGGKDYSLENKIVVTRGTK
ncbi:MAG TPA: FixH family protein [Verrucomicrobiae bacterium]|nr:FixH family protein [Verrucomicrobiae bacterium]